MNVLCTFNLGRLSTRISFVTLRKIILPEIGFCKIESMWINFWKFRGFLVNLRKFDFIKLVLFPDP